MFVCSLWMLFDVLISSFLQCVLVTEEHSLAIDE